MNQDRWYQVESYNAATHDLEQGLRPIVCLPTGSGKTRVAQKIALDFIAQDKRVLFIAHRSEITRQASRSIPGIEVSTVQSSAELKDFDLIIIDECHHVAAPSYKSIVKSNPNAALLGLTATPTRLDGKSLKNEFDSIIQVAKTSQLIEEGWISGIRLFVPEILIKGGAYTRADLKLANTDRFNDDAVAEYLKTVQGKKGVVFCSDRAHAHAVASRYLHAGIRAAAVDGETPDDERQDIDRRWASGEIDVLCNCELYTEGVDLPDVDFVQILRPTNSLVMYFQMIGRGMRQGGQMILLDHTDNWQTHGLPSDDHVFTLEPDRLGRCAKPLKERTELERLDSGEVIDTGRPIIDYELIEIERWQNKKDLARKLVDEGVLNRSQVAKEVGVSSVTIGNWFPEYRRRSDYTKQKEQAQMLVSEGVLSRNQIAKEVGVNPTTVRDWFPEYRNQSDEKRKEQARILLSEGVLSKSQIAKEVGVDPVTIRKWFPEYRRHSDYTKQKEQARILLSEGVLSKKQIARKVGVESGTICKWFPEYRRNPPRL